MTDQCSSAVGGGLHGYLDLSKPYFCVFCHAENEGIKKVWLEARAKKIAVDARTEYQQQISSVALQLLQQFMSANMIRDMGQVIRDTNSVKAPLGLTEMLDMSLTGAIHFVNELSQLQPGEKYVSRFAQRFDAAQSNAPLGPYPA